MASRRIQVFANSTGMCSNLHLLTECTVHTTVSYSTQVSLSLMHVMLQSDFSCYHHTYMSGMVIVIIAREMPPQTIAAEKNFALGHALQTLYIQIVIHL